MKINELTGIKNYPKVKTKSYYTFKNMLKDKGFVFLNDGLNGITFMGKNSVLKIFRPDQGYERFISLVKNIPSEYKPFAPKITSIRKYPPNPEIKFIKIEKLTEFNLNDDKNFSDIFSTYGEYLTNDTFENYDELFTKITDDEDQLFLKRFPIEFINFIIYLYNSKDRYRFDLHNDNIMMRGTTPVVIDPYI
jgi:hypothetical protein